MTSGRLAMKRAVEEEGEQEAVSGSEEETCKESMFPAAARMPTEEKKKQPRPKKSCR